MTVILAYAGKDFVFLGTDSYRHDLVQNRNVGPVKKLHRPTDNSMFACGGQLIDRDKFSVMLTCAKQGGVPFVDGAAMLAPPLFEENKAVQARYNFFGKQFLFNWYAECEAGRCLMQQHGLPENLVKEVEGFDCMGPDTPWLVNTAQEVENSLKLHDGAMQIDLWAFDIIAAASEKHPTSVGFPANFSILRRNGKHAHIENLSPENWDGANPAFLVKI